MKVARLLLATPFLLVAILIELCEFAVRVAQALRNLRVHLTDARDFVLDLAQGFGDILKGAILFVEQEVFNRALQREPHIAVVFFLNNFEEGIALFRRERKVEVIGVIWHQG